MSVYLTFHLTCVRIILVRFRLLSGHLLGNSYSVDYVFSFVCWLFVVLVISCLGFEGWFWALIASVPDFCILLSLILKSMFCHNVNEN